MSQDENINGLNFDSYIHEVSERSLQSSHEQTSFESTVGFSPLGSTDVPSDILSDIFSWCCPTYNDHLRGPPFAALTTSHVCRSWRYAVFETPALWTYTTLNVYYTSQDGIEKAKEQLRFWLARSQNCPVLVKVEFIEDHERKPADNVFHHVKRIINDALACKPYLTSIGMEVRAAIDATSAIASPVDSTPQVLEQYSWAKTGMRPDRPEAGSVQIHVNRFAGIAFGLEGHATLGPYLVHLNLCDASELILFSVQECQIALSNFPQLEYCAFRIGSSADEVAEPVVLRHMRTLILSWTDGVEVAALLDSITAPNLGELELRGPLFPPEFFPGNRWSHLRRFLRRSSPRLYALSLADMDCTTLDVLSCLGLCHGLQHLSLEACQLDEELMDSLQGGNGIVHNGAIRTLMGLEFLSLVSCDIFGVDEFLISYARQELWDMMNLSQLYIVDCGYISEDVIAAMRELPLDRLEIRSHLSEDEIL